jgi:hypothetical protein
VAGESLAEMLARQKSPYEIRVTRTGQIQSRLVHTRRGPIPVTIFASASTRGRWQPRFPDGEEGGGVDAAHGPAVGEQVAKRQERLSRGVAIRRQAQQLIRDKGVKPRQDAGRPSGQFCDDGLQHPQPVRLCPKTR